MKLYSHEEMLNRIIGVPGTARRDEMEAELQSYLVGEAIKQARKEKNLTQSQLGELMGIKKAQVSRIESGRNITINTVARAFKAMGLKASLNVGSIQVALW